MENRALFTAIPYRSYFRLPHGSLIFVKAGATVADVPQELRMHPEAPRGGFMHPKAGQEVIPITPDEYAAAFDPDHKPGIPGLRGLRFTDDGYLCLLFEDFDKRSNFLQTLVDDHLDASTFASLRMGQVLFHGRTCFQVALHFSDLKTPITIPLPQ